MRKRFSYSGTVAVVLIVALACLVQSARLRAVEEKPSTEPAVISIIPRQASGAYSLRLITPRGISNPVPFEVTREAMIVESGSPHQTRAEAEPVRLPAVVN